MTMKIHVAVGIALALVTVCALPSNALAAGGIGSSTACDGYGPPDKSYDGLTAKRAVFGGTQPVDPTNSTVRGEVQLGEAGVVECDAALQALAPELWQRKVSLLRSRALHRLAEGDAAEALKDLDLADAVAASPPEPYFARSLLLGNAFVRAYALRLSGDQAGATALAVRTWNQRPYNRRTGFAALAAMGPDADPSEIDKVQRGLARLNPGETLEMYGRMVNERRFAEVIAFYSSLTSQRGMADEPMSPTERAVLALEHDFDVKKSLTQASGAYAYALAATGRAEEAEKALEDAHSRLADNVQAIAKSPLDTSAKKPDLLIQRRKHESRTLQEKGDAILEDWSAMVRYRLKVSSPSGLSGALMELETRPMMNMPMSIDLADAMLANLSSHQESLRPGLMELREKLQPKRTREERREDLSTVANHLPDPETPERMDRYQRKPVTTIERDYGFISVGDRAVVTVRLRTGSPAMVEEIALLHAAEETLKRGKSGFVITDRADYKNSLVHTFYSVPTGEPEHSGFTAMLDLTFVDLAAPPAKYAQASWRIVDANEVYRTLGPIYGAPVQPGGRE